MTAYVAGCCCGCGGTAWSCSEDRVKLEFEVIHTITGERSTNVGTTKCCQSTARPWTCEPTQGPSVKHVGGTKAEIEITYKAKARVYLIPPTGTQPASGELGEWVMDNSGTCQSVWLNSGGANDGPFIEGTWKSEAVGESAQRCLAGQNCNPSGDVEHYEYECDVEFVSEPSANLPVPSNLITLKKFTDLPYGSTGDTCDGATCIFELQYRPDASSITMQAADSYFAQGKSFQYEGETPNCVIPTSPVFTETDTQAGGSVLFPARARMTYRARNQNTCAPPLDLLELAPVPVIADVNGNGGGVASAWANINSLMQNVGFGEGGSSFYGLNAGQCIGISKWTNGGSLSGLNGVDGDLRLAFNGAFYQIGQPGLPSVTCDTAATEQGRCDGTNNVGNITQNLNFCTGWERNIDNGYMDMVYEYAYAADFGGTIGGCDAVCGTPNLAAVTTPESVDLVGLKLKTKVNILSITPVDSSTC
tara:strand:- start:26672 stop:28099 length:1428 start_codon:yes stop_codon:yes gene_type:complete